MDLLIICFVGLCLVASFVFSGSETALTASSRTAMQRLERQGNEEAGIVNELLSKREQLVGGLLIGNIIANTAASAVAAMLFVSWFGVVGVVYAVAIMTVVVLVFCEVLPKTVAFVAPDRIALRVARLIRTIVNLLGPVVLPTKRFVGRMLALGGLKVRDLQPVLSGHDELRSAANLLHNEGSFEKRDRDMLGGLLDLRELTVGDVMIHRTEMITYNADDPPEKIVDTILNGPVTRVPIWRGSQENIIGIVHARDILRAMQQNGGDASKIDLAAIAMPPWFVPNIRPLSEQLAAFRRRKTPLALVVDEYGEVQGVVTLEDIIEEIVGDIADEYEVELPGVRPQPDGAVNVDGSVPIRDLNRAMDWSLPDEEATTIAGLVIHEARSIPEAGQSFTFYGFRFNVLRKSRNRIVTLRITPIERLPKPAA